MKCFRFSTAILLMLVCVGWVMATLEPTGLAKPIADLRDYNGTYFGSPGTGRFGYGGTLYRDNQDNGATSGCRGEGCGKHPGVDIPVNSGTSVYSAIGGVVVISECNESWGGLIVIRATNPWNFGEQIFLTYAHLKTRRYSSGALVRVGDYVSTGDRIASSGGGANDACAGNSTGAHLHFQIDKDDGNDYPWYPHSTLLNTKDDNYEVMSKTYNPVPFITGGYRWTFANRGDRELWDLFNFQSWGVTNNALWTDSGNDPYIRRGGLSNCGLNKRCNTGISAEALEYQDVYLDLYNQCTTGIAKVYFTTKTDPGWSESKSVSYYPWYGAYNTHVRMAGHPKWSGIITGLRVDPSESCNPNIWDPTYFGEITLER